jgi:hypothetical protein
MLRRLLEAFFAVVVEESLRAFLPHLLPYAWLIILTLLTWELLNSASVRNNVTRIYSQWGMRHHVISYAIVCLLGAGLLAFYWWGISKAFSILEPVKTASAAKDTPLAEPNSKPPAATQPPTEKASPPVEPNRPHKEAPPRSSVELPESGVASGALRPFPGFQEKEATEVSIIIGNNNFPLPVEKLKSGERFGLQDTLKLPITIYIENGVLCADVSLSGGTFDSVSGSNRVVDIKVICNKFEIDNPSYDANWATNAFEIVRDNKVAIFQMIHRNPNTIEINGIFTVSSANAIYVSQEGLYPVSTSDPKFQSYGLVPIFKYPSWKFPGQYADGSH